MTDSLEYYLEDWQNKLYNLFQNRLEDRSTKYLSRKDFGNMTEEETKDIMNGDFNGTIKRFIEICIALGVKPDLEMNNINK